jgi:peptide/nickel transport system permease protein
VSFEAATAGLRSRRAALGTWRAGRRRGRSARVLYTGLGLIGLIVLASVVGAIVLPEPNEQNLLEPLAPPSLEHPFGTDELGRDVLSRTLAATWLDLGFGIGVTYLAATIGVAVGALAGYAGGWPERILMRLVDAVIAFPYIVFVLAIVAIMGAGAKALVIAVVGVGWATYARFARGEMLVLRERQYIQAAQTLGLSRRRVLLRHAVPNLLRPIVVFSMSDVVFAILALASLSFLGLGIPAPTPEWGAIIAGGQEYLQTAWWISVLPGLVVVMAGLGFVLIGDALSERLGVRQEVVAK